MFGPSGFKQEEWMIGDDGTVDGGSVELPLVYLPSNPAAYLPAFFSFPSDFALHFLAVG